MDKELRNCLRSDLLFPALSGDSPQTGPPGTCLVGPPVAADAKRY